MLKENEIGMLEWDGERCSEKIRVDTYDDHCMAMLAPGAIVFGSLMNDPCGFQVLQFWDDLEKSGL